VGGFPRTRTSNSNFFNFFASFVAQNVIILTYAIITKKAKELKSDALPLFSRINLQRAIRSLISMGVVPSVQLVPDDFRKN
jgi:uncharacterized protein (TIGR04141 family)